MATKRDAQTLLMGFRNKYPAYKDVDDQTLLSAIQKKYPQYGDISLSSLPHSENLIQKSIQNSKYGFGQDIPKIGFQTAQGALYDLPQNIAENPMTYSMSGIPGTQMKAGMQTSTGLKKLLFGGKAIEPETTAVSDEYMKPKTFEGQLLGLAGNILGGSVLPIGGAAKGVKKISEFPYKETLALRKSIPPWVRNVSSGYGEKLESLINKSGGEVPTNEVANIYKDIAENQDLMGKLSPKIRKFVQDSYEEFSTRPEEFVNAKELISNKQAISKLLSKGKKFDVNEHVVGEIVRNTGKTLEPYVKGLGDLNKEYSKAFRTREFANKNFRPWENEFNTSREEKILGHYLKQPEGTKRGMKELETATGHKFIGKARARDIAKYATSGALTTGIGLGLLKYITGKKND